MRRARGILTNLGLLGVSLLAALGVAEVTVRLVMPRDDIAGWFQPDPAYHHTLRPQFHQAFAYRGHDFVMDVQTNAAGFRDATSSAPDEEATTVLFLGDSFVFGYGINVEDRLDTQLQKLAQQDERALRTINWGVPGWGTDLEARYARDHLAEVRPDVLVLVFCDNDPANDRGVGLPTLPGTSSPLYPIKAFLRGHSHLYRLLLEVRAKRHAQQAMPENDKTNPTGAYAISEDDWKRTENGIRMIYGTLLQANPNARMFLLAATPDHAPTREHLTAIATKAGRLEYLDLGPYIASLSTSERVLPWDGHWSPAVHAAAAQAVWEAMKKY